MKEGAESPSADIGEADRLLAAARNAVGTCLGTTKSDSVVLIHDLSTAPIAAALARVVEEIGASLKVLDIDDFGERPHIAPPGAVIKGLERATVSALAVKAMQGELTVRRAVLETVAKHGIRHAHMPSITAPVFIDSLSMDYKEVSRFIGRLVALVGEDTALRMTSGGGSDIEFLYGSPPRLHKLDGLITKERWQNIPSGQVLIYPTDANGTYVVDQSVGDWFEHKYDVTQYPVTMEFERGVVRSLRCENRRLERDLWLVLRSSDNAGRISELVIGANLGLTHGHASALYQGYRPGASISIGGGIALTPKAGVDWSAPTFLPLIGKRASLLLGRRSIMVDDTFAADITHPAAS